ncbi:Y-family DNA polymerase [Arachidicoccus ginsenosidivorans]
MGNPVLVCGASDRAVVSSCSYEVRRFWVHSAMPASNYWQGRSGRVQ